MLRHLVKEKKESNPRTPEDISVKKALWQDVLARFLKNKSGIVGFSIVVIMILLIIFAPVITRFDYDAQSFPDRLLYPSALHPFGTDNFGRDLFTRMLYGGRISFMIAFIATLISAAIGTVFGSVAGYFGGVIDMIISRFLDILMAIPSLLLAIAISAALGSGPINTALALSIGGIAISARIIRATVMAIKTNEYIEAAKATGSRNLRIIRKHILPNTFAPLLVNATMSIGGSIMGIAGLSFIGLGVKPPTPEWGSILNVGREFIRDFWPMTVFPALFIMLTIFGFNLFGDALRDALDPRLKD
ncbi:MAG: ABC transporter permease [Clostridiales bacterium]|nr:ABC transporter permease [Clostridiales bacterium]